MQNNQGRNHFITSQKCILLFFQLICTIFKNMTRIPINRGKMINRFLKQNLKKRTTFIIIFKTTSQHIFITITALEEPMVICQNNKISCWCTIITNLDKTTHTEDQDQTDGNRTSIELEFDDQEITTEQTSLHCGCHLPLGK